MRQRIECQRLVQAALRTGHTTRSLGAELGLSQASVSRLGSGQAKKTSPDALVRLIELAGGSVVLPAEFGAQAVPHGA